MPLVISSPAFSASGRIPTRYTCEGEDISPPLAWGGVPDGTRSLALIVDDPDAPDPQAPKQTYVHWVLIDLPPDGHGVGEDVRTMGVPMGAREGKNDWDRLGWGGPCPPIGRHRYFFKLYALDTTLPDLAAPTKPEVEAAMQGHIIEQAELMGTYQKGD